MIPKPNTVIITGASRGIGRAVAMHLAQTTDCQLVLSGRPGSENQMLDLAGDCMMEFRRRLGNEAPTTWLQSWDLRNPSPMPDDWFEARQLAGPIALVHCAATLGPTGPFTRCDVEQWLDAIICNLNGTARVCHAVLPRMLADRGGRIVLFSGGGACEGRPNFSAYSASKAAVVRFAETLADEVRPFNVSVVAVAPGAVETRMLASCRDAGDVVPSRKVTPMADVVKFVKTMLFGDGLEHLSGRLIHVRDRLADVWDNDPHQWRLRRFNA